MKRTYSVLIQGEDANGNPMQREVKEKVLDYSDTITTIQRLLNFMIKTSRLP